MAVYLQNFKICKQSTKLIDLKKFLESDSSQILCGRTQLRTKQVNLMKCFLRTPKEVVRIYLAIRQLITSWRWTTCFVLWEHTRCRWMDISCISGMVQLNSPPLLPFSVRLTIAMYITIRRRCFASKTIKLRYSNTITRSIRSCFQTTWTCSLGRCLLSPKRLLRFSTTFWWRVRRNGGYQRKRLSKRPIAVKMYSPFHEWPI